MITGGTANGSLGDRRWEINIVSIHLDLTIGVRSNYVDIRVAIYFKSDV